MIRYGCGLGVVALLKLELPYPTTRVREGLAEIVVPDPNAYRRPDGVYEPAWAPVFYNPRMAFNRDIAMVFARAYARLRGVAEPIVIEPLAGTGVRAIRYALEASARVYASDIDSDAVSLARINVELNRVSDRVSVTRADANRYMEQLREEGVKPHLVDIDPFGTPIPFIDSAIHLTRVRGVIAATATDTAPLSGTHARALRRKYDVIPGRLAWEKEQAVRILVGYVVRRMASHEYGGRVLLAYYADHYVRIYIELWRGAGRADKTLEQLAYGVWCPSCNYVGYQDLPEPRRCPYCGTPLQLVGPLYRGPLCDLELVKAMREEAQKMSWLTDQKRAISLLEQLEAECGIVKPYYRLDRICSMLRRSMPKVAEVVEELRSMGYRASRTHFDPRGFKTEAPHPVVVETVYRLARRRG
jgi:tRNA (guanine26-N2/guanine27-N2)-dimethyltransferase